MDRGELRRGIGAELIGEHPAGVLERGQRLGPPSAARQRPHELPAQPLPQGMRGHQRHQLHGERLVPAKTQRRLDLVFDGGQAKLIQPRRLGPGEGRIAYVGQRRAPPQVECLAQQRSRPCLITGGECPAAVRCQPHEPVRVDVVAVDSEPVARRLELHQRPLAAAVDQGLAQPGDLGLQGVRRSTGRVGPVEPVDEPLRGHDPGRVEEQQHQERTEAGSAQGELLSAGRPRLRRAQDAEADGTGRCPRRHATPQTCRHMPFTVVAKPFATIG